MRRIYDTIYSFIYHEGFSDYCLQFHCYFHNVSADMSSSLFQMFVEHGDPTRNFEGIFIGIGSLRFKGDNPLEVADSILTAGE